jgi:hypothetical protein
MTERPVPVAARSKAWVCGHSLAVIAGLNPTRGMDVSLVIVVFCQVAVSAMGQPHVQSSTEYGVSEGMATLEPEMTQHSKPTFVWTYIARHVWLLLIPHICSNFLQKDFFSSVCFI